MKLRDLLKMILEERMNLDADIRIWLDTASGPASIRIKQIDGDLEGTIYLVPAQRLKVDE